MCEETNECPRELTKQSQHSPDPPGVVVDDEFVAKLVIAPQHIEPGTGQVRNALIQKDELERQGTSVVRLQFSSEQEVGELAQKLTSRDARKSFCGIIKAAVSRIRELRSSEGTRTFCVIDDGLPGQPSHALIFSSSALNGPNVRRAREDLLQLFGSQARAPVDTDFGALG